MADRKLAIRRLVRGTDGTMRLIFVDLLTYQPIEDMTGYELVDASNPPEPEEVESVDKPDAEKPVAERVDNGETGTDQLSNPPAKLGSIYSSSANQRFPNAPQSSLSAPVGPVTRSPLGPVGTPPKGSTPGITGGNVPSGFVKTNQGSILPELDLNRFSPPTKETISGRPATTPSAVNNQPAGIASGLARSPSVDYSEIGPNRPNPVDPSHERFLSDTANKVLGGGSKVKVTSGDVNPQDAGWTADGGKYSKSHRHTDELGADVRFVDPKTGKVTSDPNVISDIAMQAAANNPKAGLGYGKDYMGLDTLHVDQSGKGGSWGGGFVPSGTEVSNIDFARQTGIGPTPRTDIPTPTAKPDLPSGGFVSADERQLDKSGKPTTPAAKPQPTSSQAQLQAQNLAPGVTKTNSVFDQISPKQNTIAQDIIDRAKNPTVQPGPQKPATPSGKAVSFAGPGVTGTLNPGGYSETVKEGSRNWRNNNPGNIEFGNFAKEKGAIGTDGRFAVFDTYEQGRAAKNDLLFETDGYKNKTIQQAVERYAPAFENNVNKYTKAITDALGLPSDTKLSDLTAAQRDKMLDAMEKHEGFREGKTKTRLTEKGIAAGERWTGPGTGADTPKERNAAGLREGGFVSADRERNSGLNSTGNRASGAGPMSSTNTKTSSDRSTSAKSTSSGKGGGLNSAGNRASGAGPMSNSNTKTSSSSKSNSSSKSSKSPTNDGNGGKKSPGGGF